MPITDENEFHILVGEIMVWSARLESRLEACIAACLPGGTAEFSQPVLRRLNFTNQLATLHEVSLLLYEPRDPTLVEFRRWLRRLGRIRLAPMPRAPAGGAHRRCAYAVLRLATRAVSATTSLYRRLNIPRSAGFKCANVSFGDSSCSTQKIACICRISASLT